MCKLIPSGRRVSVPLSVLQLSAPSTRAEPRYPVKATAESYWREIRCTARRSCHPPQCNRHEDVPTILWHEAGPVATRWCFRAKVDKARLIRRNRYLALLASWKRQLLLSIPTSQTRLLPISHWYVLQARARELGAFQRRLVVPDQSVSWQSSLGGGVDGVSAKMLPSQAAGYSAFPPPPRTAFLALGTPPPVG